MTWWPIEQSNIWEAKAEGSEVQGQPKLHKSVCQEQLLKNWSLHYFMGPWLWYFFLWVGRGFTFTSVYSKDKGVVYTFNQNSGGRGSRSLWVRGQAGLHREFQISQNCILRPCLKPKPKIQSNTNPKKQHSVWYLWQNWGESTERFSVVVYVFSKI